MSSSSSIAPPAASLHLIEHRRERGFQLQRFFDFVSGHVRIFRILKKARALMISHELYERWGVGLPVRREPIEVLEHGSEAGRTEKRDCVFGVFVEVGVEDTLIHEIGLSLDRE